MNVLAVKYPHKRHVLQAGKEHRLKQSADASAYYDKYEEIIRGVATGLSFLLEDNCKEGIDDAIRHGFDVLTFKDFSRDFSYAFRFSIAIQKF